MRALTWDGRHLSVAERPDPEPREGWAIVRVHRAGVCNTDLEIVRGYMGFEGVLGHEFVGRVEDGPPEWLGARVVGEINFACGTCPACASGLGRHCPTRSVMGIQAADGAFAERLAVPLANLHRVPDAIDDDRAVFVEPLAAAFEILEQVEVASGAQAVVLGDGKLGLLVAQVLALTGADVRAVGRHADKLAILERRGIETTRDDAWRPEAEAADVVVDATGSAAAFPRALAATRPRGKLVLKSTVADRPSVDLAPLVIHEIELVGSRCGPFAPALDALARDAIDVGSLVSERVPLARGVDAFERARERGALKILMACD